MMSMNRIGLNSNLTYKTMKNQKITGLWVGETLPLLAQLPINPALAAACDAGKVEDMVIYEITDAVNAVLSCPKKEIAE